MSDFKTITCCECGIEFGLREGFYKLLLSNGEVFSCPSGHEQEFTARKDEVDKLKKQLSEAEHMADHNSHWLKHYKRSAAVYKGKYKSSSQKMGEKRC